MIKKIRMILLPLVFSLSAISSIIVIGYLHYYNSFDRVAGLREISAYYNLLEPSVDFATLKRIIKEVSRGIRSKQLKYKKTYNKKYILSDKEINSVVSLLYTYKRLYGLEPLKFIANISAESCWNKNAKSKVGAKGLGQQMPSTFRWVNKNLLQKKKADIWSVYDNIEASIRYWLFNKSILNNDYKKISYINISWSYNAGTIPVFKALNSKSYKEELPLETLTHGNKVEFYYTNYLINNFSAWWEEQYFIKDKK